jgi:peptidoglycan L-alanyl-D-glutamate endopeptidase CwlK
VDVMPLPLDWHDAARAREFADSVKLIAARMSIPIIWGGDWKTFVDLPHYELAS